MAVLFLLDKVASQAGSQEPTSEKGSAPGPGLKVISKECLSPKDLKKRKTTGEYGVPKPWRLARTDREKYKN